MQLEILEHVLNKTATMSCVQLGYIIATSDTHLPYDHNELQKSIKILFPVNMQVGGCHCILKILIVFQRILPLF